MACGCPDVIDLTSDCEEEGGGANLEALEGKRNFEAVELVEAPAGTLQPCKRPRVENGEGIEIIGTKNHDDLPHLRSECPEYPFSRVAERASMCDLCFCYVCDIEARMCLKWHDHCHATDKGADGVRWCRLRLAAKHAAPQARGGSSSSVPGRENGAPARRSITLRGVAVPLGLNFRLFCDFFAKRNVVVGHSLYSVYEKSVRSMLASRGDQERAASDNQARLEAPAGSPACRCEKCVSVMALSASWLVRYSASLGGSFDRGPLGITQDPCGAFSILVGYNASLFPDCMSYMALQGLSSDEEKHVRSISVSQSYEACVGRLIEFIPRHNSSEQRKREAAKLRSACKLAVHSTANPQDRSCYDVQIAFTNGSTPPPWLSDPRKHKLISVKVPFKAGFIGPMLQIPDVLTSQQAQVFSQLLSFRAPVQSVLQSLRYSSSPHFSILRTRLGAGALGRQPQGPCIIVEDEELHNLILYALVEAWQGFKSSRLSLDLKASLPRDGRNLGVLNLTFFLTKHAFKEKMESASFASQDRSGTMAPFAFSNFLGLVCASTELRKERMLPWSGDQVTHRFTRSEATAHHNYGPICGHASTGVTLKDLLLSLERERITSVSPLFLTKNIAQMMIHLENLGHRSCHQVPEKLTVSLLEHQKQNLQWMLEQEALPGICCHLWAEVCKSPNLSDGTPRRDRLWFSPVFDSFMESDPVEEAPYRGGLLCDCMGLGKTATTLALCLLNPAPEIPDQPQPQQIPDSAELPLLPPEALKKWGITKRLKVFEGAPAPCVRSRGTLVVCPVSLVGQWMAEAKRLCGDSLSIYPYHGVRRKNPYFLAQFDIVVTTYGVVGSDFRGRHRTPAPLMQIDFWRVVLDESHAIRNQSAPNCMMLGLVSNRRWLVTGTPFNTSLYDMVGQLRFLGIKNLVRRDGTFENAGKLVGFVALLRRILMRHSQGQKLDGGMSLLGLPPLTSNMVGVPFTDVERKAYTSLSASSQAKYRAIRHDVRHAKGSHILRMIAELSALRQVCSGGQLLLRPQAQPHPTPAVCKVCVGLLEENPVELSPCKHAVCGPCWQACIEADAESVPSRRQCPVCHASVDSTALCAGSDITSPVAIDPTPRVVMQSKLLALVRHLKGIRSEDPSAKSLIFSQYASAIEFLKTELPNHGFQYQTLTGSMSCTERTKALAGFQNSPSSTIFLLTLRSGAVGINLTAASNVFLLEPCLNLALEAQAVGRVRRMGQMRPVNVYKLFMEDSVESRILQLQEKQGRAASVSSVAKSEAVAVRQAGSLKTDAVKELRIADFNFLFGVEDG
jgi:SNF2 family DNA or RNA helicase